jgi:hypothetical protein
LVILSEEVNQPDVTWLLWVALGFFCRHGRGRLAGQPQSKTRGGTASP